MKGNTKSTNNKSKKALSVKNNPEQSKKIDIKESQKTATKEHSSEKQTEKRLSFYNQNKHTIFLILTSAFIGAVLGSLIMFGLFISYHRYFHAEINRKEYISQNKNLYQSMYEKDRYPNSMSHHQRIDDKHWMKYKSKDLKVSFEYPQCFVVQEIKEDGNVEINFLAKDLLKKGKPFKIMTIKNKKESSFTYSDNWGKTTVITSGDMNINSFSQVNSSSVVISNGNVISTEKTMYMKDLSNDLIGIIYAETDKKTIPDENCIKAEHTLSVYNTLCKSKERIVFEVTPYYLNLAKQVLKTVKPLK